MCAAPRDKNLTFRSHSLPATPTPANRCGPHMFVSRAVLPRYQRAADRGVSLWRLLLTVSQVWCLCPRGPCGSPPLPTADALRSGALGDPARTHAQVHMSTHVCLWAHMYICVCTRVLRVCSALSAVSICDSSHQNRRALIGGVRAGVAGSVRS